jgi:hypothetical protein
MRRKMKMKMKMKTRRGAKGRLPWRKIAMMNESTFSMHGQAFGVEIDQARSKRFCHTAVSAELFIAEAVNQRRTHSIQFGMGFSPSLSSEETG